MAALSRVLGWVVDHLPGHHLPHTPLNQAFHRPWPTTYRGRSLWVLAILIGLKGFGYITNPSPVSDEVLVFVVKLAPVNAWGWLFVAVSLYAAWMSYCHHGRDAYGYGALAGLSFGWAGAYAVTPLFFDGSGYAWQGFLSWVITGGFVLYLSSYPDPIIDLGAPRCSP